jgi:hypothetical protein
LREVKMPIILNATKDQKEDYSGVYPLRGFVELDGQTCILEDLRGYGSPSDPKWEVVAPNGYHFFPEDTHTVLGFSQADLFERISGTDVLKCDCDCDCGWNTE